MDDIPMKRNRRSGGRSARKLKRAAPLPDNIKPIGLCNLVKSMKSFNWLIIFYL